jgi:hypothetical protein
MKFFSSLINSMEIVFPWNTYVLVCIRIVHCVLSFSSLNKLFDKIFSKFTSMRDSQYILLIIFKFLFICMSLQPRTSIWNRIMSAVNVIASQLTSVPRPSSPAPEEPPRKRRRGAGKQKTGYVMPENRNQHVFEKCDWIIDGQYRRVPPYYYVCPLSV